MAKLALKFISGKYQGGEFPIPESGEVVIGRASEVDMVLLEDMVSRKHAKLCSQDGITTLADLGSTNGSFVNGEKIRRKEIKKGDRILIGTSILKVIDARSLTSRIAMSGDAEALKQMMEQLGSRTPATSAMSGDLEEVPLADLLLLFATNKKTGILNLSGPGRAKVSLKSGQLQAVAISDHRSMRPMKAICRLLTWTAGKFHFEAADDIETPVSFEDPTESILMEAARQNDELKVLMGKLPDTTTRLKLCRPLVRNLLDLAGHELETLQCVHNLGGVGAVLDACPGTDFEVATDLNKLLTEQYIEPA